MIYAGVHLVRCSVLVHCGLPRPTSSHSAWLEGAQSAPAFAGPGVLRSDLPNRIVLEPIRRMLDLCHDLEAERYTLREAPVAVNDISLPRFRRPSKG